MSSAPKSSDHMENGAMASEHMTAGAKHTSKAKPPGDTPDAMSSEGMSKSQH
jgi:hypothetical protein